jgi:UDP-hydrolysing UDP-N-acetyl-D-glucosamine 2-epimerase
MNIGIVNCARSDYGIYLPLQKRIQAHSRLQLRIYVTGMHLSPEFGLTVNMFSEDGFEVYERIEMLLSSDTPEGIAKSMGLGAIGFGQSFSKSRPDLLIIMGDRFEMHAAVVAALPFNIPIAHIHGGESTEGLIDEAIRHSISKMSHLHFPSTEVYAERIRQMGEEDWRIAVVGAPGLDNIREMELFSKEETARKFEFDLARPVALVTFHPVTLEYEQNQTYISKLLAALKEFDIQYLFTYPNADTSGRVIIDHIRKFCDQHKGASVVQNATQRGYLSLLSVVDCMIGNSSSGIIEAATFRLPVVNVGNRQRGRIHGANVVDCAHDTHDIVKALRKVMTVDFQESLNNLENPYGDGRASEKIVEYLEEMKIDRNLLLKRFVDRPVRRN